MFMSESYIYCRENTSDDELLDINIKPKWRRKMEYNDDDMMKSLSKSEFNLADLRVDEKKQHTKSLTSLNYDGDTDSIDVEENCQEELLKCEICNIEFTAYIELNVQNNDEGDGSGWFGNKSKKYKKRRNTKGMERQNINFEEYKDWAHRMEEFDPKAERKWTLQYQFDDYEYQPRLSKIVIGRGHENEFPELNNILLFDEVKGYENSKWRNDVLTQKQDRNKEINNLYSLLPTNNTCLFCFSERQLEISRILATGGNLVKVKKDVTTRNKHCDNNETNTIVNKDHKNVENPVVNEQDSKLADKKSMNWKKLFRKTFKTKSLKKIRKFHKSQVEKDEVDNDFTDSFQDDLDNEEFEVL